MIKVRIQEEKHVELLEVGKQAKNKLKELVPEINRTEKKGVYPIRIRISMIQTLLNSKLMS